MSLLKLTTAAVLAFGLDRLSKIVVVHWLDLATIQTLPVWPPYFTLAMAWNPGINFGVLGHPGARWLLVVFSVVVSVVLVGWGRDKPGWALPLAVGALVGGALGNAVDRIVYGAVADYINLSCCAVRNPYSFNVADVLIFCGAIVLVSKHRKN